MPTADLDLVNRVNLCQVQEMERAGRDLDPTRIESCEIFRKHVRNVQSAIVHTYQITAFSAVRQTSARDAADLWKKMVELCESSLKTLLNLKDIYSGCGTPELYDLTLDYRREAEERYNQNIKDAECQKNPLPAGLFPKMN